jgi:hypothetical protein
MQQKYQHLPMFEKFQAHIGKPLNSLSFLTPRFFQSPLAAVKEESNSPTKSLAIL